MPIDEKNVGILDYGDLANRVNEIVKKELEDVQNRVLLENANLSQLKEKIIKGQNDFESWKRQETIKFNREMDKIRNDIIVKQNDINLHVQQQQRITSDLQTQQKIFEGLNAERIALKEEFIKLEGKKIEIQDMLKAAEKVKSDALTEKNGITALHQEALVIQEKNKQENIRLVNLNDAIENTRKKMEEDNKSFVSLKEYVEPKIRSIKDEQEFLERSKKENQELIEELNRKIAEEKILLQSVLDKKSQLEKDVANLSSQKQEFERQKLLSKGA